MKRKIEEAFLETKVLSNAQDTLNVVVSGNRSSGRGDGGTRTTVSAATAAAVGNKEIRREKGMPTEGARRKKVAMMPVVTATHRKRRRLEG